MSRETAHSDIDSAYAWTRLAISVLLATIGCAGMWVIVVIMPAVQAEFGVTRADASLPYTMTMIFFAIGSVLFGRAIDAFGYWRPALVCVLALAAGFIVASRAQSITQFTLAQGVLIGLGSAAMFSGLIADVSHWFRKRRGVAVALAASGNYVAGAFWPAITPYFLETYGWRATYAGIGVISLATMIPLVLLLRRRIGHDLGSETVAANVRRALPLTPRQLQGLLVVAGLGCCIAMSMPQVHIVAYCMDLGYGVARGSEMLAIMLAAGIVSRVGSGFLADRIGGIRTLLIGSVLQCLALLAYIPFDGLASLYVVSFVFGLSQGGIVPCYAIIVREYLPAAEAGRRIGVVIPATIVGMAAGGWMGGWIYDLTGSYAMAFVNGIVWNLINIGVMLLVLYSDRGRSTKSASAPAL